MDGSIVVVIPYDRKIGALVVLLRNDAPVLAVVVRVHVDEAGDDGLAAWRRTCGRPPAPLQLPTQVMRLPLHHAASRSTTARLFSVTMRALVKATVPVGMSRGTERARRVVSARLARHGYE